MSELTGTTGTDIVPVDDEPGTELTLCVEPEGLLVCGDQNVVTKYIAQLRLLTEDAIETADISPTMAGHAAAAAAGGWSLAAQVGEFVRLAPKTVKDLQSNHAIPTGDGYFHGVLRNSAGKFSHQVQWQPANLAPTKLLSVQMFAIQVALATAIDSVQKSIERVEGKVERVLALAEASRAGDVRGHYVVLERLVGKLDEHHVLTNTDWESVAGLGPDLVLTIERLREHIKRTLAGFDPTKPVNERADYLRRAVEDNRLGETLHLLVVSEQSLYLWQRLRIARVQAVESEHLKMVLDDARGLLADHAEKDGRLLNHARQHLSEYSRMNRLDGFRWGATHNLAHDITQLRSDLDGFAQARGQQVSEWVDPEKPTVGDALAEVGSIAVAAGGSAAAAAGRAIGAGAGLLGRAVGNLVGAAGNDAGDKVIVDEWVNPGSTGALYEHMCNGLLKAGDELRFYDARTNATHVATVTAAGNITVDGHTYSDLSAPLIEMVDRARNGWRDWKLADGRSLRHLG